jgi:hypothetical protein
VRRPLSVSQASSYKNNLSVTLSNSKLIAFSCCGRRFRLQEVELRSLDLLAMLDDEDVALVGIVHYITVATIRLCGLLEKGKAEPLELPGVVEKAERYKEYFQSLLPRVSRK